jgi:glycerol-3-phosphate O-acyltransferase / dihydroxyacetone phosphate acyltransferase
MNQWTNESMKINVKKLSLVDVMKHRQGSLLVRLIHFVFGVAISIFFRRIELYNAENLPEKSGLIFVSNHPNALIDPLLLFVALPRNIAFLAKSTLFKMPVIGFLLKAVGALPLYRQQDAGQDVSKNQETFGLTRDLLKKGGAIAIFPEGVSHDSPKLLPLKTGAARIGIGAVSVGENPSALDLKIVPVGLYYTNKTTFRSEALLHFGEPIDVRRVELDEHGHPPKETVKELTAKIEAGLREVTVNAESDADLDIARVAEEVFTSTTPHRENLAERLDILQKFLNEDDEKLEKRLANYDKKLNELGIEPEFLALADYSKRFILKQALVRSWYLILLAPLVIIGTILHFPAYKLCAFFAYLETKKQHFDMASTMKALSGLVLMPLTWVIVAGILGYFFGWKIALLSIPFSFLCGYVALRSLEEVDELRGWLKAITVFFLKREKFLRLLAERKMLFEQVKSKK